MNKCLLATCLALGVVVATADLKPAQAQTGYRGSYARAACGPWGYGYARPNVRYGVGYAPYVGGYLGSYGFGGFSHSSYYPRNLYRSSFSVSPYHRSFYGLGGYGNLGYPPIRSVPRVQLRVGF